MLRARPGLTTLALTTLALALTALLQAALAEPLVLPHPQEMDVGRSRVVLVEQGRPAATIATGSDSASAMLAARWLNDRVQALGGTVLPVARRAPVGHTSIVLHRPGSPRARKLAADRGIDFSVAPDPSQAYAIVCETGERGAVVNVLAESETGIIYAAYTLSQLLEGGPGHCEMPQVRILDYPAAPVRGLLWIRGDDAYRHAYSQWAASWKINAYTWYVGWDQPLSPEFRDILRDCSDRGMTLIPTISWFQNTDIRYSKPEFVEPMLARVREALEAGAGAFGFNFDDLPLRLFGEDETAYGSLIEGQADLIRKVHEITEPAGASVYFCPTIYWKPYPGAQGNTVEAQYEYVRGMGKLFPGDVRTFTTTISREWADEYLQVAGRKPVFWHNFFPNDMADWKLYFEPYPRFAGDLVPRSQGAFVLGGWQTEWWKVNYLTFACNTWNPKRPCTLAEAFARLFPKEAENLTRFAVLLGSHNEPAGTMEWTGSHPHQRLRPESFFNLDPTPANTASLQDRLAAASEAEEIAKGIASRDAVPPAQAQELVAAAARMRLNYRMALLATRLRQTETEADGGAAVSEAESMVDDALEAADKLERVITAAGWPTSAASDLALKSYFESIRSRLSSGQGISPRIAAVRCSAAPTLDGRLDEPTWSAAPTASPFYVIEGTPRMASQPTEVRVLFDDRTLYLGIVCREERMDQLKTDLTRHDEAVWEDDCVEVFLDPRRTRKDYFHFIASAAGVKFEQSVKNGAMDSAWDGEWSVATSKAGDGWSVEMAIPFATLGHDRGPAVGRLGINVTREEVPHSEVSAWAITFGSFHQPSMFGEVTFRP